MQQPRLSDLSISGQNAFGASADISLVNDARFNGQRVDTFKTPGRLSPKSPKGFQTSFLDSSPKKDNSPYVEKFTESHQAQPEKRKTQLPVFFETGHGHEEMTRRVFNEQWQQFAEKQDAFHEQMQQRIIGNVRDDLKHVLGHFQNALQADVQNGMNRCSTTVLETRELQSQFRQAIQEFQQTTCHSLKTEEIKVTDTGQAQTSRHADQLSSVVKDMIGVQQSLAAIAKNLSLETIMPGILLQIRSATTEIEGKLEDGLHSKISQIQKQIESKLEDSLHRGISQIQTQIAGQELPSKLVDDIQHIRGVVSESLTSTEHVKHLGHVTEAIMEVKEQIRGSLQATREMLSQQTAANIQKHEVQKYVWNLSARASQSVENPSIHAKRSTRDTPVQTEVQGADESPDKNNDATALAQTRIEIIGDISAAVTPAIQKIKDDIACSFSTQSVALEDLKAQVAACSNPNRTNNTEDKFFQPLLESADHIKHKLEELSKHQPHEQVQELSTNVHKITTLLDEQSQAWQQNFDYHKVLLSDIGYIKDQAGHQHSLFDQLRALPQSLWDRCSFDKTLSDDLQSFRRRELEDLKGRMESTETCILNDQRELFASLHSAFLTPVDLRREVDLLVHEIRSATTHVPCDETQGALANHLHEVQDASRSMACFPTEAALFAFALLELIIQFTGACIELDDGSDQTRFLAALLALILPWILNVISFFACVRINMHALSTWTREHFFHSGFIWALAILRPNFTNIFSFHVSNLQGSQSSIDRWALDMAVERKTSKLRQECDDLKRALSVQQDADTDADAPSVQRPQRQIEQEAEHQMSPPCSSTPGAPSSDPVSLLLPQQGVPAAAFDQEQLLMQVSDDRDATQRADNTGGALMPSHSVPGGASIPGDAAFPGGAAIPGILITSAPQLPGAAAVPSGSVLEGCPLQGVVPADNVGSVSQQQQEVISMQPDAADQAGVQPVAAEPDGLDNWRAVLVNRAVGADARNGSEQGIQLPSCFLCGMAPKVVDSKTVKQYRMFQHGSEVAALLYSDLPKIMVAAWLLGAPGFGCTQAKGSPDAAALCVHILVVLCSSINIVYVLMHLLFEFLPRAHGYYCWPGLHFLQLKGCWEPELEASERSITVQISLGENVQPVAPDEFFCELRSVRGDNMLHFIQRIAVSAEDENPGCRCVFDGLPGNTDFVVAAAPAKDGVLLCHPKQFPISTAPPVECRPALELMVLESGSTWAILAWKNLDLEASLQISMFSPAGTLIRTELASGTCHTLGDLEPSTSYTAEIGFLDPMPGEETWSVEFKTLPPEGPAAWD